MPLDDLRIIILNERESGRLSEVPPTLYEGIRGHLATLQEQVYGCSDPLSDEAQALIEDIREQARAGKPRQADLFADFNGLPADFDQRVDFYNHEATGPTASSSATPSSS
jgi:hypothetical protein